VRVGLMRDPEAKRTIIEMVASYEPLAELAQAAEKPALKVDLWRASSRRHDEKFNCASATCLLRCALRL
jgi:hypothetical protein